MQEGAEDNSLNDIIWRAFVAASILAVNEPSGLDRQEGKCTDGLTLIPWQGEHLMVWDTLIGNLSNP